MTTRWMVGTIAAALVLAGGAALWVEGRRESRLHPTLPAPTSDDSGNAHLKTREGVYVAVERVSAGARSIGLTERRIQAAAESALRRKGVRVRTRRDASDPCGTPHLYVCLATVGSGYTILVSLQKLVRMERDPCVPVIYASAWDTSRVGIQGADATNADFIVSSVEKKVGEFCDAYLKDKPKKSPPRGG